jgi:hypothetical protein
VTGVASSHFEQLMLAGVKQGCRCFRRGVRIVTFSAGSIFHGEIPMGLLEIRRCQRMARETKLIFRFGEHKIVIRAVSVMAFETVPIGNRFMRRFTGKLGFFSGVAIITK